MGWNMSTCRHQQTKLTLVGGVSCNTCDVELEPPPQVSTLEAYPNLAQSVIRQWEFCRFGSASARDWLQGYISALFPIATDIDDTELRSELTLLLNIISAP